MNTSSILGLLQLATTLLMGASAQSGAGTLAAKQIAIIKAEQAIQISMQAMAPVEVATGGVLGVVPGQADIAAAHYLRATHGWDTLGSDVALFDVPDASFGDLNGDGRMDAAVIVKRTKTDGSAEFDLAVLLNQNGTLFNIADTPVGKNPKIFDHRIEGGMVILDMQGDDAPRGISEYEIFGNQLIKTL